MILADAVDALKASFVRRFGHDRCRVARAPGRVNLIGEHTDYNDGFVLPVAIDRYVTIVYAQGEAAPAGGLRGYSVDFDEELSAPFGELSPRTERAASITAPSWFDYVAGVAWVLLRNDATLHGLDFVVSGDVPIGAGLSSSAALELAVARALSDVAGMQWDGRQAALVGQRVENDYIGVNSGIMDQMASALSKAGSAMLLDCRDLSFKTVPVPESLRVVVMDTGTRRSLAGSAYNDRRASCERALRGVRAVVPDASALRDVSESELNAARSRMDGSDYRRALHVVRENTRTLEMARALEGGDESAIAELMAGSHLSLRDLYEVSSPALDEVVSIANAHPACRGARMTGAGFGGCALALVSATPGAVDEFCEHVRNTYRAGEIYVCRAVGGADTVS